ncbi:MAG: guanylate kinase [Lachnospiraceae bacterium]|nr:guanylate kinase [Lachnospiraceae bacterium]
MYIRRPSIGVDIDDTLMPFNQIAIDMANEELKLDPPLELDEITSWDAEGRVKVIRKYYNDPELLKRQKPYPGAQAFINKLSKIADVYFVTAVGKHLVGLRSEQLKKYFPQIPESNYIFTSQKDTLNLDFILDDGGHNILDSKAAFPVLVKRPWNHHITGMLTVNNYQEFLNLMKQVRSSFMADPISVESPSVFALVGPSGSGKRKILQELTDNPMFENPVTYTTRAVREDDNNTYHHISKTAFMEMKEKKEFLETSIYAGDHYGSTFSSIQEILLQGKHAVMVLDISGAMIMKSRFPTVICYVKQKREKMLESVIKRICPTDDKVKRILSIENEIKNEQICDVTIDAKDIQKAIEQITQIDAGAFLQ